MVNAVRKHHILQTYNSKEAQKSGKPAVYTANKYSIKQQTVAAIVRHHN